MATNHGGRELTGIFKDHLSPRSLQDILFNRILGHKAIDVDMILLSNPMRSRHGLQIILRIPGEKIARQPGSGSAAEEGLTNRCQR